MNKEELEILEQNILLFQENILENFAHNINPQTLSSLSNMLALHYSREENNDIKNSINHSLKNLTSYLGKRIIISYDFSEVLGLFAVAISDDDYNDIKIAENIKKPAHQDEIITQILTNIEGDSWLINDLKSLLKSVINEKKYNDILNYISQNKQKTKELIYRLSTESSKSNKSEIQKEMILILKKEANKLRKLEEYKSTIIHFTSMFVGGSIAWLCINYSGSAASALIIPSTVLGMKIASKPIDSFITNFANSFYRATGKSKYINKRLDNIKSFKPTNKDLETIKIAGVERELDDSYLEEARKVLGNVSLEDVKKLNREIDPEIHSKVQSMKKFIKKD